MIKWGSEKLRNTLWGVNGITLVIAINLLASLYFFRIDFTEEKRYTIKEPTKNMLDTLDDDIYIEVFLTGKLNSGFTRLQRSIGEILEEFQVLSHHRVHYSFTNPYLATSKKAQNEFMQDLVHKGISPINVIDNKEGEHTEKIVFPGALINYNGFEKGVMLLKGNRAQKPDEILNQSIEGLEFEFANTIHQLINTNRKRIGFLTGHGELDSLEIASFNNALWNQYNIFRVDLKQKNKIKNYDVLIMAKPTKEFSTLDTWKLDQYVMKGGKLLILIDRMNALMDNASEETYYSFPYSLKLNDLLFKYGVRVNTNLVQDRVAAKYPIVVGKIGNKSQLKNMLWPFFPIISHYSDHVITRNLDASLLQFVSSIDTVKAKGIKKTPLLFSSSMSHKIESPVNISVTNLRTTIKPNLFNEGPFVVGYLLEGTFTSLYKNRILPTQKDKNTFLEKSVPTKIIVVSDGDIAKNDINRQTGKPQQLGYHTPSAYTFANQNLLLNMVAYLANENGLIRVRNKEVKIRPLNKKKLTENKLFWQLINIIFPLFFLFFYGIIRAYIRRKKYTF